MMSAAPTLVDRLLAHRRERPTASAVTITHDGRVTHLDYAALFAHIKAFVHGLEARGIGPGEPVVLALTTSVELVTLVLALQSLRAIPMIVNPSLPASAIARRAAQVRSRLVVDPALAAVLPITGDGEPRGWRTRPAATDIAYLQLTSGTSGEPRAAVVTHHALATFIQASRVQIGIGPDAVFVGWVPLHHDLGLVRFLFMPMYLGLHVHLLPPALASLDPWLRTISATRAQVTGAPDFAYRVAARSVAADGIDLGSLVLASNGGEPVRASSIAAFERRFGCPGVIRPGYGLAEATLTVSIVEPGEVVRVDARGHVGCGRAVPGLALRVVRDGEPQAADAIGELEVRGEQVFSGYYDPTLAGGLDRSAFTADGWLRTGDTGYVDGDGVVFVLGRTRTMVKQGGALIAPREVEEAVDALPGVRLSAAIGLPNDWNGAEELVVVVEPRAEPPPAELAESVRRAVKAEVGVMPGRVLLVARKTIPLTANGKLRHAALREQLLARPR